MLEDQRGLVELVRAVGVEPTRAFSVLRIFIPSAAFAALAGAPSAQRRVCGLDYPFTFSSQVARG